MELGNISLSDSKIHYRIIVIKRWDAFYKTGIQISGVKSPGGQKETSDVCSIYFQQECWDNSMERIFF